MPYSSTSDLPAQAKNLSPKQRRAFMQAFNSAHEAGKSEKSAFKIAWAAAKKSDEEETSKHLVGQHDQASHGRDEHTGVIRQAEDPVKFTDNPEETISDVAFGTVVAALGAAPFFLPGSKLARAGIESAEKISRTLRRSKGGKDAIAEIEGKNNIWNPTNLNEVGRKLRDGEKISGEPKSILDRAIWQWTHDVTPLRKHYEGSIQSQGKFGESVDFFTDAIAYAPASSKTLYRGMGLKEDDLVRFTTVGERLPLGPSSFSSSDDVARRFAERGQVAEKTSVMVRTTGEHRSLRIDQLSDLGTESEWVSGGEFVVRSAKKTKLSPSSMKPTFLGKGEEFSAWVIDIEQISGLVSKKAVGKSLVFLDDMDKSVETMYRLGNLPAYYAKRLAGKR